MHRRGFVHRENSERLQAARTLEHLHHNARAFVGDLIAVPPQAGHVQENVGHSVVGGYEAEAFGDLEPLDDARELDDARSSVADLAPGATVQPETAARPFRYSVRRHVAPTRPLKLGASACASNLSVTKISLDSAHERQKCIRAP